MKENERAAVGGCLIAVLIYLAFITLVTTVME
jgi:hypothetical protein